jgi:hypothetical protein
MSIHMLYELIYSMNSYKNNSKGPGKELANMQGEEDGVVGAVDDAEQEKGLVVSCILISYKLYEFLFCLNSFII